MPSNDKITTTSEIVSVVDTNSYTGAVSGIYQTDMTANKALITTAAGKIGVSTVSTTELQYSVGVTGLIQTQLNSRIPKNTYGTMGDILCASSSGVPSPIHIGQSGYIFQSNGASGAWVPNTKIMQQMLFDGVMSSGDKKGMMVIHPSYANKNLVSVHVAVDGSGTTGTAQFQLERNRNSTLANMLTTVVSVDSLEFGSDTAATPYVIDTNNDDVNAYDKIYVHVKGVHATPASGVIITLGFE